MAAACHCATNTLAVKPRGRIHVHLRPAATPSSNSSACQSTASPAPAPSLGHASSSARDSSDRAHRPPRRPCSQRASTGDSPDGCPTYPSPPGSGVGASGSEEEPLCSQFFSAASLQICPHTQFLPSAHRKAVETHKNTFLQRLPLHRLKPPRTSWLFKDHDGLTPKGPDTSWEQFNSRLCHQIMMFLCT